MFARDQNLRRSERSTGPPAKLHDYTTLQLTSSEDTESPCDGCRGSLETSHPNEVLADGIAAIAAAMHSLSDANDTEVLVNNQACACGNNHADKVLLLLCAIKFSPQIILGYGSGAKLAAVNNTDDVPEL